MDHSRVEKSASGSGKDAINNSCNAYATASSLNPESHMFRLE